MVAEAQLDPGFPFPPVLSIQCGSLSVGLSALESKWEMGIERLSLPQSPVKSAVLPVPVPQDLRYPGRAELHHQTSPGVERCPYQRSQEAWGAGLV